MSWGGEFRGQANIPGTNSMSFVMGLRYCVYCWSFFADDTSLTKHLKINK